MSSAERAAPLETAPVAQPAPPAPRRWRFVVFLAFCAIAVPAVAGTLYVRGLGNVSTDDAFVRADVVQVSAETAGKVVEVLVSENAEIHAGDVLLRLDDTDARLALAQAEAALEQARSGTAQTDSSVSAASARVSVARSRLDDAIREEQLQKKLLDGGVGTKVTWERASNAVATAQETYDAAVRDVSVARASGGAIPARIQAAEVAVQQAQRQVDLAVVRAPADGIAAKVDPAVGEMVQRGQPLMALVPHDIYVTANFKETDVAHVCAGAPVDVTVDAFSDHPVHGKVTTVGAATGATFSLLPADNASGNFVKVVQRLPVRISLEETEISGHPIAVGLSATVRVDTTGCT